jgi:NAD(P)-dependent dehydrogenase (short-subunit alcohol dehydrogenase family)
VSGFEDLSPSEVESANNEIVGLLGESDETIKAGIKSAAEKLGKSETTLTNLLDKVKNIAEKIQKNTSTMIPDQQFLSQEQVATTVLTLSDDDQAKILNGKIIPGDRVFYPVKPHIASSFPIVEKNNLDGKKIGLSASGIITEQDSDWDRNLRRILVANGSEDIPPWITSKDEEEHGVPTDVGLFIHNTGSVPNLSKLTELSRNDWDSLVEKFIIAPAAITRKALDILVPGGSDDPRKFKDAKGRIVIIGPSLPVGKKISGHERAKAEVFRGALRAFATTINQELSDVLKSNVRVFLILPGTVDGKETNYEKSADAINYFLSDAAQLSSEVIFCPDETR